MAPDRDLLNVGATIALDAFTGELVDELGSAGFPSIVLKGPAIASLLYQDGTLRFHDDIDLLVRQSDLASIGTLLEERGFERAAEADSGDVWARADDGIVVDLHTTFVGVDAPSADVWNVLSKEWLELELGPHVVRTLAPAGIALHVSLHAAQHGVGTGRSLADLDRALLTFDRPTWQDAAALARDLRAEPAMSAGLRLRPAGAELAAELGLATEQTAVLRLRASTAPVTAMGIHRLFETPGIRGKLSLLAEELAPAPAFMKQMYPVARRGPVGLLASYVWRPLWLLAHAPTALGALRRARRRSS
jgi:hypothetical protein